MKPPWQNYRQNPEKKSFLFKISRRDQRQTGEKREGFEEGINMQEKLTTGEEKKTKVISFDSCETGEEE